MLIGVGLPRVLKTPTVASFAPGAFVAPDTASVSHIRVYMYGWLYVRARVVFHPCYLCPLLSANRPWPLAS